MRQDWLQGNSGVVHSVASKNRLKRASFLLAGLMTLSGCVSGSLAPALESAGYDESGSPATIANPGVDPAMTASTTDAGESTNNASSGPEATLAAGAITGSTPASHLPVPAASPRSGALALAEADDRSNALAAMDAALTGTAAGEKTESVPVAGEAAEAAPDTPRASDPKPQTTASQNPGAAFQAAPQQASLTDAAPATGPDNSANADNFANAPASAEPPRNVGFFERLFRRPEMVAAARQNRSTATANTGTRDTGTGSIGTPPRERKIASAAGLPGVKRGRALFEISGENEREETEAGVQVASVGSFGRLISPTGLILQTESVKVGCLKPELLRILGAVERRYGRKVVVTSGYRSPNRNRRAGGVRNSTHIYCKAADIQVEGIAKWDLAKFLRTVQGRGGVGTYCRTRSVHIDVGTQRDWHYPCRRGGSRAKKRRT